jgi:hypothetical protein
MRKNKGDFKKGQIPWNKGKKHTPEHLINQSNAHKGISPSLETRKKISIASKGKITWNKGKKTGPRPEETKRKISKAQFGIPRKKHSIKTRMNMSKLHRGSECNFWKGGITPINKIIRTSIEFRIWRESVFTLQNFTCQKYGIRGGDLEAHHIQNFSQFPELRFAIDNGITFSKKVHQEFHKIYGNRNNTLQQVEEFIGRKII